MLVSFFEVDVCSLARKGEQTQPDRKRRTARGPVGVPEGPIAQGHRDSSAGAACAGPTAETRPLATRAKACARRQLRGGREGRTQARPLDSPCVREPDLIEPVPPTRRPDGEKGSEWTRSE